MTTIIAAIGKNNEIGKNNDLIWHLPSDLKRFKNLTTGNCIIMGRNTFESIGKPLPNRTSIIITKNENYFQKDCLIANSLEKGLELASDLRIKYIIGGAQIYKYAIENNLADALEITEVHNSFEADTFFPPIDLNIWKETKREFYESDDKNKYDYSFVRYEKVN